MSIENLKITAGDYTGKDVAAAPDRMTGSAADNKAVFDRLIKELNAGVYVFESAQLWRALTTLRPDNAQGEYYLTDAPLWLRKQG